MVVSLTWIIVFLDISIVLMIPINNLQEFLKSHLPCSHSSSMLRIKHPLLRYIIPWTIHLMCQGFLTQEDFQIFYQFLQVRHPSILCYHNMKFYMVIMAYHMVILSQYYSFPWIIILKTIIYPCRIDPSSHLYHIHTITICEILGSV